MSDLTNEQKMLKRLTIDMYFSLTLKNIDSILTTINAVKVKGNAKASVFAGPAILKITYPVEGEEDKVDFSYYNKANKLHLASSECTMNELLGAIRRVHAKSMKNLTGGKRYDRK